MYSFGVIMDPIENINPTEDSTFAIINALQQKCNIEYIVPDTIHIINQEVFAKIRRLHTYKRKNKLKVNHVSIRSKQVKKIKDEDCFLSLMSSRNE